MMAPLTKLYVTEEESKRSSSLTVIRLGDDRNFSATVNGEMVYGRHKTCEPSCVVRSWVNGTASSGSMSSLLRGILDRKLCAYPF
jgi:hypothetical protein